MRFGAPSPETISAGGVPQITLGLWRDHVEQLPCGIESPSVWESFDKARKFYKRGGAQGVT